MKRLLILFFCSIVACSVAPMAASAQQKGDVAEQYQKLSRFYRYLSGMYVDEVEMKPLVDKAIREMLSELDPHSYYLDADAVKGAPFEQNIYRLGGNSCLSGDYMGSWQFAAPLQVGDKVVFEDMIHYTTVKTNMFNGISHPSIALLHENGELEMYKVFGYEDYRDRMC